MCFSKKTKNNKVAVMMEEYVFLLLVFLTRLHKPGSISAKGSMLIP
jgi:hypothetical protein